MPKPLLPPSPNQAKAPSPCPSPRERASAGAPTLRAAALLSLLLAVLLFPSLSPAQTADISRMTIHQSGKPIRLSTDDIDLVTFDNGTSFTDLSSIKNEAQMNHDNFSYSLVSRYSTTSQLHYNDIMTDDTIVYAVTANSVRKLNYADELNPQFIGEGVPFINYDALYARAIDKKNDDLYIAYRVTFSDFFLYETHARSTFETKVKEEASANATLSNNNTLNAFFKSLDISGDIAKAHQVFIHKAAKRGEAAYTNIIRLKMVGEADCYITNQSYPSREEALSALQTTYKLKNNGLCEVDWNAIPEGVSSYTNVLFNSVKKTEYHHSENADYSISPICCPNTGNHSGEFSISTQTGDSALISFALNKATATAEASLWIRIDSPFSGELTLPLFYSNDRLAYALTLLPSGGSYQIAIDNAAGEKSFTNGVWYNIKATYKNGEKKLFYRQKECSDWKLIGRATAPAADIDRVTIGIQATEADAIVYLDDFFYCKSDIDGSTYNKGKVAIADKNTFRVKTVLNLDFPVTDIDIHGDRLIVSGLSNLNIYSLEDADSPQLTYTYRPESFRDCQGVTTYEHQGRVYAAICNYIYGILILDITDVNNVTVVADDDFADVKYKGAAGQIYNFSSVVDYPYIYTTIAPHPDYVSTIPEACGVLSIDISNPRRLTKRLFLMDPADISSNTTGDPVPTRIARYGNSLYLNNRDRGLAVFNILDGGTLDYRGLVSIEGATSINAITITDDGRIFMGDDQSVENATNINLYRITEGRQK